jgi:hypothetical protein
LERRRSNENAIGKRAEKTEWNLEHKKRQDGKDLSKNRVREAMEDGREGIGCLRKG